MLLLKLSDLWLSSHKRQRQSLSSHKRQRQSLSSPE
jgi:hypothetical protein